MIFPGDAKVNDLVTIWPLFLAYLSSINLLEGFDPKLLSIKKGSILDFSIPEPMKLLGLYLDYFCLSKKRASLLHPQLAESLLTGSVDDFLKKMESGTFTDVAPFADDYMRWVLMREDLPEKSSFYRQEASIPKEVFKPLFDFEEVL